MSSNTPSDRVIIFDTTLRDGEQSPGASMNLDEKIRIARVLEGMGVDIIEAGFPAASRGDFEAVREVAKVVRESVVCGLARATHGDIDRAAEAIKPAERGRIHTFISTSPLHMRVKLQMEPEEVLARVIDSVRHARRFTDDVEWSCEDGSRSDHDFLCRCVEAAIDAGAGTINIPDTVGYAVPDEFAAIIRMLRDRVPNIDRAILSVHCHNDLGLAVANSLAAVDQGARQIECTINGLGERAGNAAMEEIVMALRTRADRLGLHTNIKTDHIMRASRLVSAVTGFVVQPNKAIVGANAFAHESGIHQDGVLKDAATYEIMSPESVGLTASKLVMGKHSGRHAFREKLKELHYDIDGDGFEHVFNRFKELADLKKDIYDEDLMALVDDELMRGHDRIRLVSLTVECGTRASNAHLTLDIDGTRTSCEGSGHGPVDSAFGCIKRLFESDARLQLYQVHAVTGGTDAQAEVTVRLEENGRTVNGQAADTDTLVASVKAYLNALNKLLVKREKTAPAAMSA
jgi:2-isopropylmalate synthase